MNGRRRAGCAVMLQSFTKRDQIYLLLRKTLGSIDCVSMIASTLVDATWDSIVEEVQASPLTESQKREIDRRLADQANPDAAILWDQVEAEALSRVQKK